MNSLKWYRRSGGRKIVSTLAALPLVAGLTIAPAAAQDVPERPESKNPTIQRAQSQLGAEEQDATQFIVHWQESSSGLSEAEKLSILDETFAKIDTKGEKLREATSGGWVIAFSNPVESERVPSLQQELKAKDEIKDAYIDMLMSPAAAPNDPDYEKQWPFHSHDRDPAGSYAKVEEAWDLGYLGGSQNIAIVDSGITDHPDLDSKVRPGYDMITNDRTAGDTSPGRDDDPHDAGDGYSAGVCPNDPTNSRASSWHGTHVAGIAAASTNNGTGGAGTAPEAGLIPVRAMGKCGGYASDIADAVVWAVGGSVPGIPDNPNPAKVVNMSISGHQRCVSEYQRALKSASDHGATVVVAAGNANGWTDEYQPANCNSDALVVVGATGPEGYRAEYSNFGDHITIGAPGGNSGVVFEGTTGTLIGYEEQNMFYSTLNSGRINPGGPSYGYEEGTSMASPLVAGVVAMMKDANPDLTSSEIREILQDTAQPYNPEPQAMGSYAPWKTAKNMGAGIVDACEAVHESAVRAGKNPQACGETSSTSPTEEEPKPSETTSTTEAPSTVSTTIPAVTETVTTTTTAPAPTSTVTATKTSPQPVETTTSTVKKTTTTQVTVPGTEKSATVTVTKTEGREPLTTTVTPEPTIKTEVQSGEPTTVTETSSAAPATEYVTETEVITPSPETVTTTVEDVPQTVENTTTITPRVTATTTETNQEPTVTTTETVTATEIVNENRETVTDVSTVVETTTNRTSSTETVSVTPNPVTTTETADYDKKREVQTSSVGSWPLLLLLPLGLFTIFKSPALSPILHMLPGKNIGLQKLLPHGLAHHIGDFNKWYSELFGSFSSKLSSKK